MYYIHMLFNQYLFIDKCFLLFFNVAVHNSVQLFRRLETKYFFHKIWNYLLPFFLRSDFPNVSYTIKSCIFMSEIMMIAKSTIQLYLIYSYFYRFWTPMLWLPNLINKPITCMFDKWWWFRNLERMFGWWKFVF